MKKRYLKLILQLLLIKLLIEILKSLLKQQETYCGTVHAAKILKEKKHLILVNVEADIICGKYLSDLAKENGVICSMAYGDQPSLIIEQIEWARLNGFELFVLEKEQNTIQF